MWLPQREAPGRYRGSRSKATANRAPDGARVACGSARGIRVVDLVSGAERALTDGADRSPCWSPDGRTLAFVRGATGARALHVVPAAGGPPVRLQTTDEAFDPAWSPDGRRLACALGAAGRTRVAFLTLAGATVAAIARSGVTPFSAASPRWRADGRGVVYLEDRRDGGNVIVRRLFVASHTDTPAADRPGAHASPCLGPDSESLVYVLGNELWAQPRRGVEPRRLF